LLYQAGECRPALEGDDFAGILVQGRSVVLGIIDIKSYIVPDRKVDNSDSWSQNSQLAFHAGGLFLPRPSLNVEFLLSFGS
jgi:hypothetical protein